MIDPIADMLTRIRNAQAVSKREVVLPMSKIKKNILEILKANNWIEDYQVIAADGEAKNKASQFDQLKIVLKYVNKRPAISNLKRVSKPSLRVYVTKEDLPKILNNYGMAIISTSAGLLTNFEAKKKGVGGEVVCEIY